MLNEDSSLEELKSYLLAGAGATLAFTPEEALNFIVALDEERRVDGAEKEERSSLHRRNNRSTLFFCASCYYVYVKKSIALFRRRQLVALRRAPR